MTSFKLHLVYVVTVIHTKLKQTRMKYSIDPKLCSIATYVRVIALVKNIEDITCPRVDMNFIFEWSTRYLTSERSEQVRYRVDHEKIKFISISGHVMFCLLHKHQ